MASFLSALDNLRLRKSTFATRSKGLKKKIHELTTLCDLEACLVGFGSDGEIVTWPEDEAKLLQTIKRYRDLGKKQRHKYMVETSYTTAKKTKSEEQSQVDGDPITGKALDELSEESLRELDNLVSAKLDKVRNKRRELKKEQSAVEEEDEKENQTQTMVYNPQPISVYAGPNAKLDPLTRFWPMTKPNYGFQPQYIDFMSKGETH